MTTRIRATARELFGVAGLADGARHDLLRVLMSDSRVRANVIRQFHERGDERMVEVLAELEADELLRRQVIDVLQDAVERTN